MDFYNDNDPTSVAWLRELIAERLIPEGSVNEKPIQEITGADLRGFRQCHFFAGIGGWPYALQLADWPAARPVWTGSCPCQPFSQSGKGKGFADERHLWPEFASLIRECRPDTIFGEQVASPDGYAWLDVVCANLEGMGYACGTVVTPAAGYGAPHMRHRIYWVANLAGDRRREGRRMGEERSGFGDHGRVGHLADSESARRRGGRDARAGERTADEPGGLRHAGRMAHADGRQSGDGGIQRGGQHGLQPEGSRAVGVARGDANSEGPQERPQPEIVGQPLRIEGPTLGAAGPLRGFWGGADWLYCRDGKYRPVEPGTFPLAYGIPGRVGLLRGYGNAIDPQQAAAFIGAFLECERA